MCILVNQKFLVRRIGVLVVKHGFGSWSISKCARTMIPVQIMCARGGLLRIKMASRSSDSNCFKIEAPWIMLIWGNSLTINWNEIRFLSSSWQQRYYWGGGVHTFNRTWFIEPGSSNLVHRTWFIEPGSSNIVHACNMIHRFVLRTWFRSMFTIHPVENIYTCTQFSTSSSVLLLTLARESLPKLKIKCKSRARLLTSYRLTSKYMYRPSYTKTSSLVSWQTSMLIAESLVSGVRIYENLFFIWSFTAKISIIRALSYLMLKKR